MKIQVRIPRELYEGISKDLRRPHPFAAERIGFAFGREARIDSANLIVALALYVPVADEQYIDDEFVGARIDAAAIRQAMQHVLGSGDCAFHVHMHGFSGRPRFSDTDLKGLGRLIPSFHAVGPSTAHGALLINDERCMAEVWLPRVTAGHRASSVSIVGYPFEKFVESNDDD